MSATDVVLSARYRAPRLIFAVNTQAAPEVQQAQLRIADGLAAAERELVRCGFALVTAQHLTRMAALQFLNAFDGAEQPVGAVLDALIDRINREGWLSHGG